MPADVFYTFPAHAVAPVLPEAHEQNGAVIAAVSSAAAAFASRGYEVFLDGIVGPWFLPVVAAELASAGIPVEYVVLQVSLENALRRATSRTQPGSEAVVRHMHAAFQQLGEYASHALDTTDLSIDETLVEFARRRSAGIFALNLARVQTAGCRTSR
jgi:hypothetical protein